MAIVFSAKINGNVQDPYNVNNYYTGECEHAPARNLIIVTRPLLVVSSCIRATLVARLWKTSNTFTHNPHRSGQGRNPMWNAI